MNSKSKLLEKATEIAKHLAKFAKNEKSVLSYQAVCDAMKANGSKHKYGCRKLDSYLDEINKKSNKIASVSLSVLVVSTANKYKGKKMPGKNFFKEWAGINPKDKETCYDYFIKERDRVHKVASKGKLDRFIDEEVFLTPEMKDQAHISVSSQEISASCPPQLSKKSIEIAQHLVECAKNEGTLGYSEIGRKVNMDHRSKALFNCLGEISELTYLKADVLLSVLVIRWIDGLPGPGFFNMAIRLRKDSNIIAHHSTFITESERVYKAASAGELDFILTGKTFND